ncbi:MAG TPA: UvrD-helicase domain-containing protein [Vicinamibacterales bacterium]|nr:UvrD-helicase domain-containing protein [Vicinamibacterales bacterium]
MHKHVIPPDHAERERITADLATNMLVEAGAGSGKTESLAQRMVAGILAGYGVSQMAAVTFTRKAAAELRGRFQIALEEALARETGPTANPEARERLTAALAGLESFFAGTIHSFYARLLRERPVEAGLAPGFTEVEETEDAELRKQAWREYLARERGKGSALLQALADADVRPRDLDYAFAFVCTFEEVEFPPGEAPLPDTAKAWKALEKFLRSLERRLPGPIADDTTCKVQQRLRDDVPRLGYARRDRPGDLVDLLRRWEANVSITQKCWSDDPAEKKRLAAEISAIIEDFKSGTVTPFLAEWRQYVYRLAMPLLTDARAFAREARFRALQLNYNDLLQGAARLLRDHPEVRRSLQQKYRWLYVDEFQDTDPVQAEVMLWLASDPSTPPSASDPFAVRLRPGSLFIVGDPKQSIYRFRRADIEVYNRVREAIVREHGCVVPLVASWRSVSAICTWVSDAFEHVFPEAPTAHQAKYEALKPVVKKPGGGVVTLTHPETLKREEVFGADAAAIARYIRAECDAGRRRPGDFLILTWKRKHLGAYAAALEALEVPAEVTGAGAFGDSAEVRALAVLLRVLGDPDDGGSVVGVLRSLVFGVSDDELFQHRHAGGWFTPQRRLEDGTSQPGHPRVLAALYALGDMLELVRELPAPAAVERILDTTGLLAQAAAASPGGARAGDLLHAVDRVREAFERGGTLADAALALQDDVDAAEVESWPLEPGRTDVVRVMNLHKAKGLEAPVVFLADPCGGFKNDAELRIDRGPSGAVGHMQVVWKDEEDTWRRKTIAEPENWAEYAAVEQPFLNAEAERLRYVAATRARELLVISRWEKTGGAQPWLPFEPFLAGADELEVPPKAAPPAARKADLSEKTRTRLAADREVLLKEAMAHSYAVVSVTASTHQEAPPGEQEGLESGPATGAAFGDLVHRLLEHAMRRGTDAAAIERYANWLTFEKPDLQAAVPEALAAVRRVTASGVWEEALAAEARDVEVPFTLATAGADGTPTLLNGVIDLAYRTADGWVIVDYKTDQLGGRPAAFLLDRYGAQIDAYCRAWAELTGTPPARAGIHAVRSGETVWRR